MTYIVKKVFLMTRTKPSICNLLCSRLPFRLISGGQNYICFSQFAAIHFLWPCDTENPILTY